MGKRVVKVERTLLLAQRLIQDIRDRGLKPNDPYYTTVEAAEFLDVSGASANRALQLLEKRKVLVRRQKMGAIIVHPSEPPPLIHHVHFLLNHRISTFGNFGKSIVNGIRDELPQTHISYTVFELKNEMDILAPLLQLAKEDNKKHAFVMLSSSPTVQKAIGNSPFPHVLMGTKTPGAPNMSQMDISHESALRLLVGHLREQERLRIAVMMKREILPGDVAIINTAVRLGIPTCFFLQHDADDPSCVDELCELFQTQFDPNGIVCHSTAIAEACRAALAKLGKSPNETEITVMFHRNSKDSTPFTYTATQVSSTLLGHRLGQLLTDSVLGLQPVKEVIPVKLVLQGTELFAT